MYQINNIVPNEAHIIINISRKSYELLDTISWYFFNASVSLESLGFKEASCCWILLKREEARISIKIYCRTYNSILFITFLICLSSIKHI